VLVGVGWPAASSACAVAVARTLSTKDNVGVGKGRNCRYPYPPNRQAETRKQNSMEMPNTPRSVRFMRSCMQ
jgi:hypothetical protein